MSLDQPMRLDKIRSGGRHIRRLAVFRLDSDQIR
jgi:hypothetical protein